MGKITFLFCAVFCGSLGVVRAGEVHGLITQFDQDHDQRLSWPEVDPIGWNKAAFEVRDSNNDGFVDTKDLAAFAAWTKTPVQTPKLLKAMDSDEDGKIQTGEWLWDKKDFDRYDRNQNSALDPKEFGRLPRPKKP